MRNVIAIADPGTFGYPIMKIHPEIAMSMPADSRCSRPMSPPAHLLPLFVLADISGSINELRKIDTLNDCVTTMIKSFAAVDSLRGEIQVGVVTFGSTARPRPRGFPLRQ